MFVKVSILFIVLHISRAQLENRHWDVAVAINDQIELFLSNGTFVGTAVENLSKLKAVTFDNVRHQFVVSDMEEQNDTIFSVQLTSETDIKPIIEDLPDDVQGLAIDPITDILYWADSLNKTINYISLNNTSSEPKILFSFPDENPQDIAIDVCHRFIYWTNSNINKPTIERAKLDGTHHEVLVDWNLHKPTGIAIDYNSGRIFWADMKEGIYYTIESTNLEGKERKLVCEGTHSRPFGVAVDLEAIYWTDISNNALWRISKYEKHAVPKRLRSFNEKPMGIVANNVQITSLPDCQNLSEAIRSYKAPVHEVFKLKAEEDEIFSCLNAGQLAENYCKCPRGFTGRLCEISLCHNYCVHGDCHYSSQGYPKCYCPRGFTGNRCEMEVCDDFCLNGGICSFSSSPLCDCQKGFSGSRCEVNGDLCTFLCQNFEDEIFYSKHKVVCSCGEDDSRTSNITSAFIVSKAEGGQFIHFKDPGVWVSLSILIVLIFVIVGLSRQLWLRRRQRPRIKKRIIVSKNITPLTYRPRPATEQCEITIENCCNMNICETPCFEPPRLGCKAKNDDKKKLLSNMENGEEVY